jgi:heme/copper-type cytochrome/quinol oxidase subunit 4
MDAGNLLYWFGCVLSALIVALGIWLAITDAWDGWWHLATLVVCAMIVWLIGRICRNVLSGLA